MSLVDTIIGEVSLETVVLIVDVLTYYGRNLLRYNASAYSAGTLAYAIEQPC